MLGSFLLRNKRVVVPLMSILGGGIFGTILMLITGYNPMDLLASMIRGTLGINVNTSGNFFNSRYIGEFLVFVMPITLTGLAVAFSFRIGLFNIGAEGQVMLGSWAAITVGLILPGLPKIVLLPLVILSGFVAGALWGAIPGILKARYNIHEVVVTIMLNYAALYLSNYGYLQLPRSSMVKTNSLSEAATLQSDLLSSLTNNSRLHWGFVIVLMSVLVFWFVIEKTVFGYELRATGFNKTAAAYAGIKTNRNIALSMMISGGFAGLAGVMIAIGTFSYGRVLVGFENYGFDGIAVALIGNNTGLGVFISSLLFGSLKAAQPIMQTRGIPRDIITTIIAVIVLMVGMQNAIYMFFRYIESRSRSAEKEKKTSVRSSSHPMV